MENVKFNITATDNHKIFVNSWIPDDKNYKAIVVIIHGMAEHSERYSGFANFLTENKISVFSPDLRGHGKTAGSIDNVGFISDRYGWQLMVDDVNILINKIKSDNPAIPVFVLGHSMGSIVARSYIINYGNQINGLILSGPVTSQGMLGNIGQLIAYFQSVLQGKKTKSHLLNKLSFGNYNNEFMPNRTQFDWLSKDNDVVDKYIADEYCGGVFSAKFFHDLLGGINNIYKKKNFAKIPKSLPILIFCGDKDPVSKNSEGVKDLYEIYKKFEIKDIFLKIYQNGRHEMLNETNKHEVYNDVLNWIVNRI